MGFCQQRLQLIAAVQINFQSAVRIDHHALHQLFGLPTGFLCQGAASGHEREKQGKGKLFPLSDRACQLMLTMECMSLISNRRFMYSSTRTWGWPSGS